MSHESGSAALLEPEERVLSTLEADGSRRWIHPRLSRGKFLLARRVFGYGLIAYSILMPFLRIGGRPAILIDIPHRRLDLMGSTFAATDTSLLALLLLAAGVCLFLFTALFGRIWCGWACPQTVYLELVYRPLERLFHGTVGRGGEPRRGLPLWRKTGYLAVSFLVSILVGNLFLSYFVGVEQISRWVVSSPAEHPFGFAVMSLMTLAMMFNFTWFREQMCILVCPYGRFQSALVDRHTLQVRYHAARGEPRAKGSRGSPSRDPRGSCIDCGLCVKTCPTGIDIRDGVQLECVGCAQCIDACDTVMRKIGDTPGLIRYSTQARDEADPASGIRPRLLLYPVILAVIGGLIATWFLVRQSIDVTLLRSPGLPFVKMPTGTIANNLRLKIVDRGGQEARYRLAVLEDPAIELTLIENPIVVPAEGTVTCGVVVTAPPDRFRDGRHAIRLRLSGGKDIDSVIVTTLLGPNTDSPVAGGVQ